ncbi:MAG: ABC transporter permease subunit, partial [Actinomycetia bacterium]|nr:ABC transporter permease subunit [Actinomycetes bacterium]
TAGFLNTIRIILVGIPASLLLGTLVAIARLSSNWLLRKIATGYVEFFRNIPPLVVIIFIWRVVFLEGFPAAAEAWRPVGGWFIFSNSRFSIPSIAGQDNFAVFRLVLLVGLVVALAVGVWRTRVFNETGHPHHRVLWSAGTFLTIGIVAYLALGGPAELSKPGLDEAGRVYTGGFRMQMPYAALTTALVIYTATHIAEIVRGSILAVHRGQEEAANALALSAFQRYRFVILPQAMRIAFPPLINQFLNFSKNSSLALAIGFAEITSLINNLFGQSQPAPQLLLILMLLYLTLSLVLSAIGNLVNRRLQIVGR